jgi:2,3-dihydro-2,3-dihydroxybenzoate dehydrogenase
MVTESIGGLNGKFSLVTGAAQGIGESVARALIKHGVKVAALDTQADELKTLEEELGSDCFIPYTVDISDSAMVDRIVEHVDKDLGSIDYLVNVAGVLRLQPVVSLSDADWEQTFAVNATGVFNVSRSVARVMMSRRMGAIVTVGSNAATVPRVGMAAYAASKAAATHFTRCLGLELSCYGIRCNIVSPGSTDTPMQQMLWSDEEVKQSVVSGSLKDFRTGIPLGRIATPENITDAVLFLLSERACHVTMHDLRVDGGATLGA